MCQIYLNNIDVFEYVSKDSNLGGNTEFFVPYFGKEGFFFICKGTTEYFLTKQEDIDNVRFKICQRKSRGCKTEHP